MSRRARLMAIGATASGAGALAGLWLVTTYFNQTVHLFASWVEVSDVDTGDGLGDAIAAGFSALGLMLLAVLLAVSLAAVVVAALPLALLGAALGAAGVERTWLVLLITLPMSVGVFLLLGNLVVPDGLSQEWWLWPAASASSAAAAIALVVRKAR